MQLPRKIFSIFTAAGLLLQAAAPAMAQQSGQSGRNEARIQVTSELVLVNVVAHDKKGNLVRDLKKGDFTLLEDGKKQDISTFDFENVDEPATAGAAEATVSGAAGPGTLLRSGKQAAPSLDARDRRLILLFFDFSAMEPEQIERSVDAAKKFVGTKMQPADLIALVSLATNMRVDLDFTDDKTKLLAALTAYKARVSKTAAREARRAQRKQAEPSRRTIRISTRSAPTASSWRCSR
jgi:VWFA-related protein